MTELQFKKKLYGLIGDFVVGEKDYIKAMEIVRNQGITLAAFATNKFCEKLKENDSRIVSKNLCIKILKAALFK